MPAQLLQRNPNSNKKDFGHVFILAGCASMLGAACLVAQSALRSGSGLVTVGVAKSLNGILQKKIAIEIMTKPLPETKDKSIALSSFEEIKKFLERVDVLAMGPGLSRNISTQKLIRKIIAKFNLSMVIDADALNALIGYLNLLRTPNSELQTPKILTPHPGEMARLLNVSLNAVQKNRLEIAKSFAKKYNCILVLKGNKTVIADSNGNTFINHTGNPGMATAGCGDVLTGMIASFLGQGIKAFEAAKLAVYLHGLAGDLAAKEKTQLSLIASDIIEKIPEAIKKCN
ncbi:MAG: NAD(P)H-hydrate dehydratase [Candidatus Omnitrophota bacterium]|nr:NAD(P)H-hydrate dehydratase [Candidatus Omnitrophota bacterium]